MTVLNEATLSSLATTVGTPGYDRAAVSAGIVHFGVGAFHRAHEAMFIDDILARGFTDWAICGVGVLEGDRAVRDALRAQDNLYTLVTSSPDGTSVARVIGSIHEYLYAPDDPNAVLDRLADPATRIVSLTITEGGYSVDDATGEFDPRDPLTLHDLQPGTRLPASVLGYITAGLARRRAAGTPPFTVMTCDNIQGNGHVARTAVAGLRRPQRPRPRRLDRRERGVPQLDGRPHYAGDDGRDARERAGRVRHRGSVAGSRRILRAMGPRGHLPLRPAAPGAGWRPDGRRRRAVRADEAAAPERLASGDGLSRHPGRRTVRARGVPGSRCSPTFSSTTCTSRRCRRCGRCRVSTWTPTAAS